LFLVFYAKNRYREALVVYFPDNNAWRLIVPCNETLPKQT
jgi:hypothetical protein